MEFSNFGLEQKLGRHSWVKFHSDFDGNGLKLTPELTPKLAFMTPKMKFFDFGLEQKLDRHSCVEFHSDSMPMVIVSTSQKPN